MGWNKEYFKEQHRIRDVYEWLKNAEHIENEMNEYDRDGNCERSDIYRREGKLYRISRFNDHLCDPIEVKLVSSHTITVNEYKKV